MEALNTSHLFRVDDHTFYTSISKSLKYLPFVQGWQSYFLYFNWQKMPRGQTKCIRTYTYLTFALVLGILQKKSNLYIQGKKIEKERKALVHELVHTKNEGMDMPLSSTFCSTCPNNLGSPYLPNQTTFFSN